ncbi:hypothetical protein LIER_20180 [Lithospermum erythrorhizon]|uniref:Uncharacterized protein n=1 Tax=Lithospermum erythrorhizon TaxID=34254 RepID=A0AAV3QKJ3_LITER
MTWTVRHTRKMFSEDCVQCLYEVYDEYFTAKVYVGGKFKLFPTLIYEGGTTLDIDYLEEKSFDLKDIDEFSLRFGYPVGSRLLYVYREPGIGLAFGLKLLLSADDVVKFREKCLEIYVAASPNSELCRLYTSCKALRVIDRVSSYFSSNIEGTYVGLDDNLKCPLICNEAYDASEELLRTLDGDMVNEADEVIMEDDVQFFIYGDNTNGQLYYYTTDIM